MEKEKLNIPVGFFDLPLEDVMPVIAKNLDIDDILAFRCCSQYCKSLGDTALAKITEMYVSVKEKPGWKEPYDEMGRTKFSVISQHCCRLRKIDLAFLDWLTDEMLIELFKKNPILENVQITSCKFVSTKSFHEVVMNCKELKNFGLEGITCSSRSFLNLFYILEIHLECVDLDSEDPDGFAIVSEEFLGDLATHSGNQARLEAIKFSRPGITSRIFEDIEQGSANLYCPYSLLTEWVVFDFYDNIKTRIYVNCPKLSLCLADFMELFHAVQGLETFFQFLSRKNIRILSPQ